MAKFFIHRPIFAIVISLIIVIVGAISAFSLPIAQYPQVSPPTVQVSAVYVGANASVVNQTVAQILENQINGTQGMDYMNSTSDDSGSYTLNVTFELATDGDSDAVKVQNAVAIANSNLPAEVIGAGVTTEKTSSDMALVASIASPNATYDSTFIKNYADVYIVDKIKRVAGVGKVQVLSADYSMRIWVSPDRLNYFGLTIADIQGAIQRQNVQASGGTVGALPTPANQEKQFSGHVTGRLTTIEEFGDIILKQDDNGGFVRIKDVAKVDHGAKNNNYISRQEGKPAVVFMVNLTNDANAMVTVNGVKEVLAEAEKDFPPDMKLTTVVDSTKFISASLNEVYHTFMEALALVIIIVFLFLQSWRATLIPVLAVPVSLIGTFAAFVALDFSINTLTLFAMVLAIGLVVDDAIVVIENVELHMKQDHMGPIEATEVSMDEVSGPVVAIACVLAAVFVPMAFLGGTTGVLYKQFALTIAISMGLSAFIALTLTPALCAVMLKAHEEGHEKSRNPLDIFFDWFNRVFDIMNGKYTAIVTKTINLGKTALIFILILCGGCGWLFTNLPATFVPNEDQAYIMSAVRLPEGTSMNRTMETIDKYAESIKNIEGIKDVITVSGYDIISSSVKSNSGTVFISLEDWKDRPTYDLNAASIAMKTMITAFEECPEALIMSFEPPALPGFGSVGGWTMQLLDISGHTDEELKEISEKIMMACQERPEVDGVSTTFSVSSPVYNFDLDRTRIGSLGIELNDVFTTMQVNYGGAEVNSFNEFGRTYKVMIQSDESYRSDVNNIKYMYVRNNKGEMVPLNSLVTPRNGTAASSVTRFNNSRSLTFNGAPGAGYSSGQAMAAMEEIVASLEDKGLAVEWSGQSREEKKASGSTTTVMALAIVFVFLCLAALYESWLVPFAVLLSVPIGVFGALFSEFALLMISVMQDAFNQGLQNSVYMQIGIIMIIGLSAKNAILIVEFAKARVDNGMDFVEAAIESANQRLRPILMTSLAFIIGCLPLVTATGAGAASRNGMGVAVVGGMIFATTIGVFLIPLLYVLVMKFARLFTKKK